MAGIELGTINFHYRFGQIVVFRNDGRYLCPMLTISASSARSAHPPSGREGESRALGIEAVGLDFRALHGNVVCKLLLSVTPWSEGLQLPQRIYANHCTYTLSNDMVDIVW